MEYDYVQKLFHCYSSMYEEWIIAIENYRLSVERHLGIRPSDKLITAFCKFRQIPYPLPN